MDEAVCGTAPIEYVCVADNCVAKGVCLPEKMTHLPAELEAWQIVITLNQDTEHERVIEADWLGLFASEGDAQDEMCRVFALGGGIPESECSSLAECRMFEMEACPVTLQFKGGVS
jgi:hypothetical protein